MLNYSLLTEIVSSTTCIFQTIDIDKLHCVNKLINSLENCDSHERLVNSMGETREWSTTQWVRRGAFQMLPT